MTETTHGTTGASRPHVFVAGRADLPPLLLLHGTGGNEHDLIPLAQQLAADAPLLSPRGMVTENGLARFFRRLAEGVFDEDDLRGRVDELADFVLAAQGEHGITPGSWQAVGFSNGANIASALLLRRPEVLAGAVLIAAMVPFREPGQADLTGKRVAVVNGRRDPTATMTQTRTLVGQLRERGAEVVEIPHEGGHTLDVATVPRMRDFLRGGD